MKPAATALLFALLLSVSIRASEGIDGNWIAGPDAEETDLNRLQVILKTDDSGTLGGSVLHNLKKFAIQGATVSGNSLTFSATQQLIEGDTSAALSLSCTGVVAEGTIDLTCEVPGGVKRYLLTPHIGA